jgi:hypothetical protein
VRVNDWALEALRHGFEARGLYSEPLTEAETCSAEDMWQIRFPPDLRRFLQVVLPSGFAFPDWRHPGDALAKQLRAPVDGVLFDVKRSGYWYSGWGERPAATEDAVSLASKQLRSVPRLIPVYGHRYIPQEPMMAGNPILSVVQTDIVVYGSDLEDYIAREFSLRSPYFIPTPPAQLVTKRDTPFWGDLVS